MREHSGRPAPLATLELAAIGKTQSPYCCCYATFPACFCIALSLPTVLCDQLWLLYASWIAHLIPGLTQYGKKGFGEEVNVIGSRELKKLQRTANSDWLVCAGIRLDCSFSLSIMTFEVRLPVPDIDREAPTQIIVFGL